jgi:hypothetical protein
MVRRLVGLTLRGGRWTNQEDGLLRVVSHTSFVLTAAQRFDGAPSLYLDSAQAPA